MISDYLRRFVSATGVNVLARDIKFAIKIGSDWHQMGQMLGEPKCTETDFKKRFVPFGANVTKFGWQI